MTENDNGIDSSRYRKQRRDAEHHPNKLDRNKTYGTPDNAQIEDAIAAFKAKYNNR